MNKTKIIIFGTNKPDRYKFFFKDEPIEIVKEFKYLGILFFSSGSFLCARKSIASQAKKAMHLLYTRIFNLDLPIDLQIKLFDQTIVPILTYNCEVWGIENLDLIERVHTEFLRKITKSKRSTPLSFLYGDLGRVPLEIVIKSRIIQFWCKLLAGKTEKIARKCYEYMLHSNSSFKWIDTVKSILDSTGYTYIWLNQKTVNLKNINHLVKHTLTDQFIQKWHGPMLQSAKCSNYKLFKRELKFENYFKILPQNLRLNLFHLRSGNNRLPIETGSWPNPKIPYDQRKCPFCTQCDIGDIFHYILRCPLFDSERKRFIKPYFYRHPNVIKFAELFSSDSETILTPLAIMAGKVITYFNLIR